MLCLKAVEIQNGDLCEADQTRVLGVEVEEEEGAVGGILECQSDELNSSGFQVKLLVYIMA